MKRALDEVRGANTHVTMSPNLCTLTSSPFLYGYYIFSFPQHGLSDVPVVESSLATKRQRRAAGRQLEVVVQSPATIVVQGGEKASRRRVVVALNDN